MPLAAFITEVMDILKTEPTPAEICVQNVGNLSLAAEQGRYEATFNGLNSAMAGRF
jgi:short-subunit dehydrogenase involved in D-alanine esterification of teichoic acids